MWISSVTVAHANRILVSTIMLIEFLVKLYTKMFLLSIKLILNANIVIVWTLPDLTRKNLTFSTCVANRDI